MLSVPGELTVAVAACCFLFCFSFSVIFFPNKKQTLTGHDHNISCVTFTPSGDHLLSCSRDTNIKVWEVSSGFCVKTISGHTQWVRHIEISPRGNVYASCSDEQVVKLWNSTSGENTMTLYGHEHVVHEVKFSNTTAADEVGYHALRCAACMHQPPLILALA